MRKGALAEWILARFIDRQRAASIVGDLIEEQQRGAVWFWWSLMGVTFSSARRPLGGFLLAAFAGGSAVTAIQSKLFASFLSHAPTDWQRSWTTTIGLLVGFVWITMFYSTVRFGLKDPLTRSALGCSLLGTVAIGMWWQPTVPAIAARLGLLLFATAMFFRDGRKAVGAIAILTLTQCLVWMVGLTLFATIAKYPFQTLESVMKISLFAGYFLLTWLICAACTWVHRTILE
jgi:hypothetical protein